MHNMRRDALNSTSVTGSDGVVAIPELFDATEVAAAFRCTPSWLKEQARKRLIPFTMLGGSYRWTADQCVQIVAQFEQRPGNELAPAAPRRRPAVKTDDSAVTTLRARRPARKRSA